MTENDRPHDLVRLAYDLLMDLGNKFEVDKEPAVVLPVIQIKEIQKIYIRVLDEILMIVDIPNYLKKELENKEIDLHKCYYHIDNFYQRLYILEQMYYRLIAKILLRSDEKERGVIENALSSFGYKKLSTLLTNFSKDKHIKEVRKRRKELVHRTGHSARELVELWSRWNGSKKHISDQPTRDSQKRFCRKEYEKILDISLKYLAFIFELLKAVSKHLRTRELNSVKH